MLAACAAPAAHAATVPVSVTTTILADFVREVGGNRLQVNVIVPAGGDTHTFQPGTGVIRELARSRALFTNGAGLEPWLPKLTASAPRVKVVALTSGLNLHAAGHEDEHGHADAHEHGPLDPHAWWDPALAAGYVRNVQQALTSLDPAGKATYARNAGAYLKQLSAADVYAKQQFSRLSAARRVIVTNHDSLHYLAERYGLRVVGAIIPGISTEREPSARELASLSLLMKKTGAKVIFTENTVNARLAQTLARETGARIAPPLYTDALGAKGSGGDTFLKAFRSNVDTMVGALKN
ncbi:zinc ABC transporter substrate-binding protein [Deinococcus taeanensis]|uniref:metal ABC transporter solute-binding protein, Zn/Mn family n=1 Tax=Deinococcus taeanensis TaxID=2737050 RepID=UPI001CDD7114|nr:zinc ABC transporter substrate-binding protein [Deinococcus taeanensis]UBV44030.1 zinc ABC transporter substrate-binding protein [Deinococcus taeanensis]